MVNIHWFRLDPPKVNVWQKKSRKQTVCGGGGAGHRTGAAPARTEPTATVTAATTRSPTFSLVALGSRLLM